MLIYLRKRRLCGRKYGRSILRLKEYVDRVFLMRGLLAEFARLHFFRGGSIFFFFFFYLLKSRRGYICVRWEKKNMHLKKKKAIRPASRGVTRNALWIIRSESQCMWKKSCQIDIFCRRDNQKERNVESQDARLLYKQGEKCLLYANAIESSLYEMLHNLKYNILYMSIWCTHKKRVGYTITDIFLCVLCRLYGAKLCYKLYFRIKWYTLLINLICQKTQFFLNPLS